MVKDLINPRYGYLKAQSQLPAFSNFNKYVYTHINNANMNKLIIIFAI